MARGWGIGLSAAALLLGVLCAWSWLDLAVESASLAHVGETDAQVVSEPRGAGALGAPGALASGSGPRLGEDPGEDPGEAEAEQAGEAELKFEDADFDPQAPSREGEEAEGGAESEEAAQEEAGLSSAVAAAGASSLLDAGSPRGARGWDDPEELFGPLPALGDGTVSRLPRTSSRAYNELSPSARYLVYTPSGGFSNQLICLLGAIHAARRSNRTVVVPMKAKHSDMWGAYWGLRPTDLVPFDHALDFDYMERMTQVPLLPLNVTLREFHQSALGGARRSTAGVDMLPIRSKGLKKAKSWQLSQFLDKVIASSKHVVVVWGGWFNHAYADAGNDWANVRFAPYLARFSEVIARRALNSSFNAVHVRLGDYTARAKASSSVFDAHAWASRAAALRFDRELPLYIATDDRKNPDYFKPLLRMFRRTIRLHDILAEPVVAAWMRDLRRRVPGEGVFDSLFGMVDQLVCARADKFVGTALSTFTQFILESRKHIARWLPDVTRLPGFRADRRADGAVVWGPGAYNYHPNAAKNEAARAAKRAAGST
jgi:hypothetical protein